MASSLKFGATYVFAQDVMRILDFGPTVEQLGFDSVWCPDHIVCRRPLFDCLTVLAAFASRTRLEVGSAVLIVPLRNPAVLAKAVATLDILSEGRFRFGVGVGGEYSEEFEACGIPIGERGRRTDEALEVMQGLWSGNSVSHEGRFHNFSNITMLPAPMSRPGPPLYIGGRAEPALRRTARFGDVFFPFYVGPDSYAKRLVKVREYAEVLGRDPASIGGAHYLHCCVGSTREEAVEMAVASLSARHILDCEYVRGLVDKVCAVGTPVEFAERVVRFISAGATHIVFEPLCAGPEVMRQYEIIAHEVLPLVRASSAN